MACHPLGPGWDQEEFPWSQLPGTLWKDRSFKTPGTCSGQSLEGHPSTPSLQDTVAPPLEGNKMQIARFSTPVCSYRPQGLAAVDDTGREAGSWPGPAHTISPKCPAVHVLKTWLRGSLLSWPFWLSSSVHSQWWAAKGLGAKREPHWDTGPVFG